MLRALLAGVCAVLAIVAVAAAETRNGVTPLRPERAERIPESQPVVFEVRARGGGAVFMHVCRNRERNADGVICRRPRIRQMRRRGDTHRYRYTEPAFGLPRGLYYWQAYRIRCEETTDDCRQEGPISRFRVTSG